MVVLIREAKEQWREAMEQWSNVPAVPGTMKFKHALVVWLLSFALLSSSTILNTTSADVTIPPDRFATVDLGPSTPDGPRLFVLNGGTLSTIGVNAVTMDSGTSINNDGIIENNGAGTIFTNFFPTNFNQITIFNNTSGIIRSNNVGSNSAVMVFDGRASGPINVLNLGTIIGQFYGPLSKFVLNNVGTWDARGSFNNNGDLLFQNSGTFYSSTTPLFINLGNGPSGSQITNFATGVLSANIIFTNGTNPVLNNRGILNGTLLLSDGTRNGMISTVNLGGPSSILNGTILGGNNQIENQINIVDNFTFQNSFTDVRNITIEQGTFNYNAVGSNTISNFNMFRVNLGATANLNGPLVGLSTSTLVNSGIVNANANVSLGNLQNSNIGIYNINGGLHAYTNVTNGYIINSNAPVAVANRLENFAQFNLNNELAVGSTLLNTDTGLFQSNGTLAANSVENYGVFNLNKPARVGSLLNVGTFNVFDNLIVDNLLNVSANTLNINHAMTATNSINVGRINLNDTLTGDMSNFGILAFDRAVAINGNYTQSPVGVLSSTLTNQALYGQLNILGNSNFIPGSQIQVLLAANNSVTSDNVFDIVRSGNALPDVSNFTFVFPENVLNLHFTPSIVNGNILRLSSQMVNYAPTIFCPNARAIAEVFDYLRVRPHNSGLDPYFLTLNRMTSNERETAFKTMSPDPYAAAATTSFSLQNEFLTKVVGHIDKLRFASLNPHTAGGGYRAGDIEEEVSVGSLNNLNAERISFSPIYFTNGQKQKSQKCFGGYKSSTNGFGLLSDIAVSDDLRLGLGVGAGDALVRAGFDGNKRTKVENYQGLLFAGFDRCRVFADGVLSFGRNRYHERHNIQVGAFELNSKAKYTGTQFGSKLRLGYAYPIQDFEIAPLATYFYTQVKQRHYTQQNADVLNLHIRARQLHLSQAGAGLRFAYVGAVECFVPEFHALYLRALNRPNLRTTANFLVGGPAFSVFGPRVAKDSYNFGLSLSALLRENWVVVASYDLETAKRYYSNSATLKLRWLF